MNMAGTIAGDGVVPNTRLRRTGEVLASTIAHTRMLRECTSQNLKPNPSQGTYTFALPNILVSLRAEHSGFILQYNIIA